MRYSHFAHCPCYTVFSGRLPIPVPIFLQMIRQNAGDWTKHAEDEFQALELHQRCNLMITTSGSLEQNRSKNRQLTVVPFDHNRVKLKMQYEAGGTDYINASYISGYRKPTAYIATQVSDSFAPCEEQTREYKTNSISLFCK